MLTFRSLVYINETENTEIFCKAAYAIVGTVIIFLAIFMPNLQYEKWASKQAGKHQNKNLVFI